MKYKAKPNIKSINLKNYKNKYKNRARHEISIFRETFFSKILTEYTGVQNFREQKFYK